MWLSGGCWCCFAYVGDVVSYCCVEVDYVVGKGYVIEVVLGEVVRK